jgi:hypothetical protein
MRRSFSLLGYSQHHEARSVPPRFGGIRIGDDGAAIGASRTRAMSRLGGLRRIHLTFDHPSPSFASIFQNSG